MHPQKFADMTIQTAPIPTEGRSYIWDNSSPLGLQISSTGVKSFVVILGRRRKTIGQYGHITLQQARTAAKQLKAEHTLGRLAPSSRTIAEARDEYLKNISVRPNTRRYYVTNLNRLPDIRLTDLSAAHLNPILDALPSPARIQCLKVYVAFCNWCIRRHYLDTSPCTRFRAPKATSRSRVLSDSEIKSIWHATTEPTSFNKITRLLLLTGQRKNEIANIRTSWIKDNKLTIPKEYSKNARDHCLPLGPFTLHIISSAEQDCRSGILFPAPGGTIFSHWTGSKIVLDKASGVTSWVLHDLRRTVASNMGALGIRLEVIERILNHVSGSFGGVAGTYQRYEFLPEMRAAIDLWEAKLQKIVHGGEP